MLFPEYLETWRKTDFGCYSYFCTYYEWLWANNLTSLSLISCNNSRTHLIELSRLKSELLINCLSITQWMVTLVIAGHIILRSKCLENQDISNRDIIISGLLLLLISLLILGKLFRHCRVLKKLLKLRNFKI